MESDHSGCIAVRNGLVELTLTPAQRPDKGEQPDRLRKPRATKPRARNSSTGLWPVPRYLRRRRVRSRLRSTRSRTVSSSTPGGSPFGATAGGLGAALPGFLRHASEVVQRPVAAAAIVRHRPARPGARRRMG